LAYDVLIGKTNNKAILGGVILVLVLNNKSSASIVIGFALYKSKSYYTIFAILNSLYLSSS